MNPDPPACTGPAPPARSRLAEEQVGSCSDTLILSVHGAGKKITEPISALSLGSCGAVFVAPKVVRSKCPPPRRLQTGTYRILLGRGSVTSARAIEPTPGSVSHIMDEERAAVKIQALKRGNQARGDFKDVRDEEARRQWVEYYLQTRNYEEARELGWDGDPDELEASVKALGSPLPAARAASSGTTGPIAITSDNEQAKAARLMQAHVRGSSARLVYREKRDDEARAQWVAYYLAMGDLESARELGWDESQQEQAQAATALAATRRGQLARRSLAAGVAIPGAMPFPDLPKPDEAAPATPERHAAFGGKTENEMALDTAQEGAGIFSARWFGKLWNALSPEKSGREGEGEAEGGGMKEDAAAIIVQCWARVVLAKIAVEQHAQEGKHALARGSSRGCPPLQTPARLLSSPLGPRGGALAA